MAKPLLSKLFRVSSRAQTQGQALVEYVLISVLIIFSLVVALALTGPVVGNVFTNTVASLLGQEVTPDTPLTEGQFWGVVTAVASYTPQVVALKTNTPAPEGDSDGDGIVNSEDRCPTTIDQIDPVTGKARDTDGDGIPDACDPDSAGFARDDDRDGYVDRACVLPYVSDPVARKQQCDNCIGIANPDQADTDGDGYGDLCPNITLPTDTPAPTATPPDRKQTVGYKDTGSADDWETDFQSLLKGPWRAEYWDMSVAGCMPSYSGPENFSLNTTAEEIGQEERLVFPRATHSDWTTANSRPRPNIFDTTTSSNNFCARFSGRFRLEAGTYTWRYRISDARSSVGEADRLRITANGTQVVNDWDGVVTNGYIEVTWNVPDTRDFDIVVTYIDVRDTNILEVYLLGQGLRDVGTCNWTSVTSDTAEGGSVTIQNGGNRFWSDSPAQAGNPQGLYAPSSYCILRLRGTVAFLGVSFPFVTWEDQHALNNPPDKLWFAVREIGKDWLLKEIHGTNSTNYTWTKREINLAAFNGIDAVTRTAVPEQNYSNRIVEIAFIVESDIDFHDYGWFIRNFEATQQIVKEYAFPFADDMEATVPADRKWLADGSWGIDTALRRSGNQAWSDTPGVNYTNNSNSSIRLDGVIDMSNPSVAFAPELTFWHRWRLADNDRIFVEASTDLGNTWTALRTSATDPTDYLYTSGDDAIDFRFERIPLDITGQNYIGRKVMFRFRLVSDGANVSDGWTIDDVQVRNKPIEVVIFPNWCDNAETASLAEYTPEGSWGAEAAGQQYTDSRKGRGAYIGAQAFSDSPVAGSTTGGNYVNGTNSAILLNNVVDLSGSPNTILEFWHRWAVADNDKLFVEMSQDGGNNWATIWRHEFNTRPQFYNTSTAGASSWNQQHAWQRVTVPLNRLLDASNTAKRIKLRWRMDARVNSATDDGWYVDKICIRAQNDPIISLPWSDPLDSSVTVSNSWYLGNEWATVSSPSYSGSGALTDSPSGSANSGNYMIRSDSVLELRGVFNLNTSMTEPTLYYWERYRVNNNATLHVEAMVVDSTGNPLYDASGNPTSQWRLIQTINANTLNLAFNRRQVPLFNSNTSSPLHFVGKYIRLRFRVEALSSSTAQDGWTIDQISIEDRATRPVFPLPYNEDASFGASGWVREGAWTTVADNRPLTGTDPLGPGLWRADYFKTTTSRFTSPWVTANNRPNGPTATDFLGSDTLSTINFNWGSSAPAVVLANNAGSADNWQVSLRRSVILASEATFAIHVFSDDGHRVYINGLLVSDRWSGWNVRTGQDPTTLVGTPFLYTFPEGQTNIEIQMWEGVGGAHLRVDFTRVSGGSGGAVTGDPLGTQQWSARYFKLCNFAFQGSAFGTPETVPSLNFDWGTESPTVVKANNLTACSGYVDGDAFWRAEYYRKPSGVAPAVGAQGGTGYEKLGEEYIRDIRFNWGTDAPALVKADAGRVDQWWTRYTRTVTFPAATTINVHMLSDDGHRMFVNGVALPSAPNMWINGAANRTGRDPLTGTGTLYTYNFSAGSHTIVIEHYEETGGALFQVDLTITQTVGGTLVPETGGGASTAWTLEFYRSAQDTPPSSFPYGTTGYERIQDTNTTNDSLSTINMNFNWGTSADPNVLADGGRVNRFMMRATRTLRFTNTTVVAIHVLSDDGHRLLVNGTTITNDSATYKTGGANRTGRDPVSGSGTLFTHTFTPGLHNVELQYFEATSGASIKMDWNIVNNTYNPFDVNTLTYTGDPDDGWGARFERTVTFADATSVSFQLTSADGHRMCVQEQGSATCGSIINAWTQGTRTSTATYNFPAGTHRIQVEYFSLYSLDGARLALTYLVDGDVFHTDASKGGNYANNSSSSIILEGEIDLRNTVANPVTNPVLSWWERYSIGNFDTILVEVSTVGGHFQVPGPASNWTILYQRTDEVNTTWTQRFVDLTSYIGQKIVIRFRLNALNTDEELDGWYVDDIFVGNS
jgi:hypothetical protein